MNGPRRYALVLAIYLNTLGFAFVLFEGHLSPYDWGIQEPRGRQKGGRCLAGVTQILDRYLPDALVIQDTSPEGTRRARRIIELNDHVAALAEERGVLVYAYSRADVYAAFGELGLTNKQMIAESIAKHIPAFEQYVPPPRKCWMSEDRRMGIFDAAALGLLFFQSEAGST